MNRNHVNQTLLGMLGLDDAHCVTALELRANVAMLPELTVQRIVLNGSELRREWQGYRLQAVPVQAATQAPVAALDLDAMCKKALAGVQAWVARAADDARLETQLAFGRARMDAYKRLPRAGRCQS